VLSSRARAPDIPLIGYERSTLLQPEDRAVRRTLRRDRTRPALCVCSWRVRAADKHNSKAATAAHEGHQSGPGLPPKKRCGSTSSIGATTTNL
jgi:hypothetical protein